METEGDIEQAMDEFLTKKNASSVGDDRDYFELNYDDSSMNGQPLTPVTKYVKTSSNILVELRKQGTPMKNTWTPKAGTPATSRKTGGHDENHSPCSPNVASTSPPILQKLRDHRGEGPKRPRSAGVATPKPSSKSLITPDNAVIKDYKDLIQNVRNDVKLPNNTTENGDISGQETLSATRIEYGSPGTFSDRAMAFTRDYRDSSKDQSGQVVINRCHKHTHAHTC